jgi:four helix bundle protein
MKEEGRELVDLRTRTKKFALRIMRLFAALPKSVESQVLGKQLLRAGTSVGAHYREANRARSDAEFVSKLDTALAELEETLYWLEFLAESEIVPARGS